ncbi:MAG: methyltransferase domain-containing protein [Spongiibacteraceae bacterium]
MNTQTHINDDGLMDVICPLCQNVLLQADKLWRCENNHCFDTAKQGYTNLLPVQNKKSLAPGDGVDMVTARTRFLNAGYYQAVSDAINKTIVDHLQQRANDHASIIDAGCGEGYYTSRLAQALDENSIGRDVIGIDISKFAVAASAKRDKSIRWFVANSASIPVADQCADVLLSLFAPITNNEFFRCLKPGALVLTASTGEHHLIELRKHLYDDINYKTFDPGKALGENFSQLSQQTVQQTIQLPDTNTIKDLLSMTPHFWRVSPERKKVLNTLERLTVTIDIQLHGFVSQDV